MADFFLGVMIMQRMVFKSIVIVSNLAMLDQRHCFLQGADHDVIISIFSPLSVVTQEMYETSITVQVKR